MGLINLKLLANPANWLIVWLMLAIAAMGFFYISKSLGLPAASA